MPRALALMLLLALLLVAGCGGDDGDSGPSTTSTPEGRSDSAVAFPPARNQTLRVLRQSAPEEAVFAPSVSLLRPGTNRIGFALFNAAREQVVPEAVALYVARPDGTGLRGPFEARRESLRVKPAFMSEQTAADLDDVDGFWVADVPFPARGRYLLSAIMATDGKLASTSQIEMHAGRRGAGPPDVGERAISVHTDTVEDAAGNLESIDTRLPPLAELHEHDLADVLGKRPVVLAFATPQLCQTRVCGPVVDVVAEVKASASDDIAFIHQEIYADNDINKGFRPQVGRWRLPTEPWTFLIGRDGKIVERFEGALSVDELARAVEELS